MIGKPPAANGLRGYQRLELVRKSYEVERFHTIFTFRGQNLGNHSANVAMILDQLFPDAGKHVIIAALTHDLSEIHSGDIPAPAKWASPPLQEGSKNLQGSFNYTHGFDFELTDSEKDMIKIADCMELMFFCIEEYRLGNKGVLTVFHRITDYFISKKYQTTTPNCQPLFRQLRLMMEKVSNG